jgi:hypothetical protein
VLDASWCHFQHTATFRTHCNTSTKLISVPNLAILKISRGLDKHQQYTVEHVLCSAELYCTWTILYCTLLYFTALCFNIIYCNLLYATVLYCTLL